MGNWGSGYAQAAVNLYTANKQRQQDKALYNDQVHRQDALQGEMRPYRDFNLQQGQQNQQAAGNYYREGMNNPAQQQQPQLNQLAQQYRGSFSAAHNLYARGNPMGPSQAANMPFQLAGAQANLISNARNSSAGAMATLGGNQMQQGLGAFGLNAGINNSLFDQGMQMRQQQYQHQYGLGQSYGNAFNTIQQQQGDSNSGSPWASMQNWWAGRGQSMGNGFYSDDGGGPPKYGH